MQSSKLSSLLLLCRPEFTASLREELLDRGIAESCVRGTAPGWIHVADVEAARGTEPFIFERQRILHARFFPADELQPLSPATADAMLGDLPQPHRLWTVHTMIPPGEQEPALSRRAEGIVGAARRMGKVHRPELERRLCSPERAVRRLHDVDVLQLMLTPEGAWTGVHPLADLSVPRPGGILRMKHMADAPSRSSLKLEEAFVRMDEAPQAGQTVVDLGAAPGGWTYACARRGAKVIAVDHGPLKGWAATSPLVQHLRENGLTYRPPAQVRPVDWLVADMLIAPAMARRLISEWTDHKLARRLVVNIKIPQHDAYRVVKPILEDLRQRPTAFASIRQLYHDRREVTLMTIQR